MLDILKVVLKKMDINHLVLTGTTPKNMRQSLVNRFMIDEGMEFPVFLLSTKAGGLGINLTAAMMWWIQLLSHHDRFDQDFNPQNDRQAEDQAYHVSQEREVDIIRLICRNTIEEDMLKVGQGKLVLDDAIARVH
jgi:SWI/SNF-related matrix-associated actin-dependent regulator of chromatin subfamily A containing DEAD/H box 1